MYDSDYYGMIKVTASYTGFESEVYETKNFHPFDDNFFDYTMVLDTPWFEYSVYITSVVVEDKVRFASLESLFAGFASLGYADVGNIDVSKNTSLSLMFSGAARFIDNNRWCHIGGGGEEFCSVGGSSVEIVGFDKWGTSNITDMSGMFVEAFIDSFAGISNWNTSSVIDVSYMFMGTSISYGTLDLSKWNVDKATEWLYFYDADFETNIIPPAKFIESN